MTQICPLMSRPVIFTAPDGSQLEKLQDVVCHRERCALWIEAHTIEFPEIRDPVGGCAIAMAPQLNADGKFRV